MKKILFTPLLLFCMNTKAQTIDLKSKIEEVTVFQNGAQVTRKGSVALNSTITEVKVKNVSPLLKRESIQVKGEGDFVILSVYYQTNFDEQKSPVAGIKELETKQKELEAQIEELSIQLDVLNAEERLILGMNNTAAVKADLSVETVLKARAATHVALNEIKTGQLKINRELKELREKLNKTTQELSSKRLPKTTGSNEIVVKILVKKEVKADFTISYVVGNARWYPTYDLRVKNISEPLVIEYKANISQQTGEDWNDVKLTLSTTDPSLSGQKPKLQKWNLYMNQYYQNTQTTANNYQKYTGVSFTRVRGKVTDEYGEALPFANVMAVGSTVGTTTDIEGNYSLTLPTGISQIKFSYIGFNPVVTNVTGEVMNVVMAENRVELSEVTIVTGGVPADYGNASGGIVRSDSYMMKNNITIDGVTTRGSRTKSSAATYSVPIQVTPTENVVSAQFVIEEKFTVLSDTRHYTASIQNISAPATYQYYCAPKLDKDVFLTALLTDWDGYHLLEGQANIFFEGTYVGTSLMDVRFLTDTLNISLGRDKGILVERKKSKEMNKKQVFGSDMIATRNWDINVKNNKSLPINIIVEDQYPVSADAKIEVKREEHSDGKIDETTGIITWNLKIDKNSTKNLKLRYSVKYPKSNFVGLE